MNVIPNIHRYHQDGSEASLGADLVWDPNAPGAIGTNIAVPDYIAGCANCTALGTTSIAKDKLWAMEFHAPPRGGTLSNIGFEVTTGIAGNGRIGLYANSNHEDAYPAALLQDSGDISTAAAGYKDYAITQALVANEVYWLVFCCSSAVTLRTVAAAGCSAFLGIATAATTTPNTGVSVAHVYAALPDPFSAGGAFEAGVGPAMRYRFSA